MSVSRVIETSVSRTGELVFSSSIIAQGNINAFSVITTEGLMLSSNQVSKRGLVFGLSLNAASIGQEVRVLIQGRAEYDFWNWTVIDELFLNDFSLSYNKPNSGFILVVGNVVSEKVINVNFSIYDTIKLRT